MLLDDYVICLCIGNSFHDAFKLKGYVKEPCTCTFQGLGNCPMSIIYQRKFFYRLDVILIFFSHSLLIARSGIDILIRFYLKCYSLQKIL